MTIEFRVYILGEWRNVGRFDTRAEAEEYVEMMVADGVVRDFLSIEVVEVPRVVRPGKGRG